MNQITFLMSFCLLVGSLLPRTSVAQQPVAKPYVHLERAFETLRFNRPVHITGAGDASGRIFVVEQDGLVHWFDQHSEKPIVNIFVDLREKISRVGNEEGLIGFAFHPDFSENGYVYCHYSSNSVRTGKNNVASNIVSQFKVTSDGNSLDMASEKILMTIDQPFNNHNGGAIAFGKDGFLYISLGDGGFRNDPEGNGQKLDSLLGGILRIDVDREDEGRNYAIPKDNPFVNHSGARPELYAIGLRNVWRFSFDRKTGELWAADVGQNLIEEVNIVVKGGNYGWNRYEANDDFEPGRETKLIIDRHDRPVAHYGHQWGGSITGGNVYRGKKYPELDGSYFFGDYMTGNLWRTRKNEKGQYQTELARRTGRSIASFGEDDDGEVYLVSFDGGIYRIAPTDQPENTFDDWPKKLSETGLFANLKKRQVADHLIPYQVNAPFWSDHANKGRYFVLPEEGKLRYQPNGTWEVPVGTTLVKNFDAKHWNRNRMVETRLIKRVENGWESATYVWNRKNSDADLMPQGKQLELGSNGQVNSWHAPSSSECAACHVDAAGYVLGLNTAQLNLDTESGKNQILAWAEQGILDLPANFDPQTAPKYCSPFDESSDLETRARVWMDVNCAMCHQPNGPGNANIDLRFTTDLSKTKTMDVRPTQGDFGISDARLIAPGNPETSLMVYRIKTKSVGRMPTIGSNQVDQRAVKLLSDWISSME